VESNGNGSLIRIIPAALYFCDLNDTELYERVKEISSVTHAHFRSVFSCFIFSKYVIELLKGNNKINALAKIGNEAIHFARNNSFNESEVKLFERILSGSIHHTSEDSIRGSGYVLDCLEASLWCFLTTDSYADAILKAINLGEDTDTTGCVTGALAGLHYGDENIPMLWSIKLSREKDIIKLAEDFTESLKKKILHGN
jgi:ADP-ribosyl-[dinitrogen reductase] hydrolase